MTTPTSGRWTPSHWRRKFVDAGRGCRAAFTSEISFVVHGVAAAAVVAIAWGLGLESWRWAVLVLCIAAVVAAELVNTAIEGLAAALHPQRDERVGRALDAAAGSVLVVAVGAAVVGLIVLWNPLMVVWDSSGGGPIATGGHPLTGDVGP